MLGGFGVCAGPLFFNKSLNFVIACVFIYHFCYKIDMFSISFLICGVFTDFF